MNPLIAGLSLFLVAGSPCLLKQPVNLFILIADEIKFAGPRFTRVPDIKIIRVKA